MNHYVNCESAKKAVAKIVKIIPGVCIKGKDVYFYGDHKTAIDHYENTLNSKIFQIGAQRAELYFRGVGNKWIEMVAEE